MYDWGCVCSSAKVRNKDMLAQPQWYMMQKEPYTHEQGILHVCGYYGVKGGALTSQWENACINLQL